MDKRTKAKIKRSEKKLEFYRSIKCKCGGVLIETTRNAVDNGQWHDFYCVSPVCYYTPCVFLYSG